MSNGIKEIKKALRKLPENIQKNVSVGAIRAGAKPLLERARANAPYEYGDLEKSIKITKRKSKNKSIVHFSVSAGNSVETLEGKKRIFYAAFIEWGYTAPNGKAVMAHPFMRTTFESEAHNAIEYTKAYYAKRIPLEIEKAKRW